jgi:hypothetical protein
MVCHGGIESERSTEEERKSEKDNNGGVLLA